MKDIRGYAIEVSVKLVGLRLTCAIHPLNWRMPFMVLPPKVSLASSWHLLLGPLHFWGMRCEGLFGFELDGGYQAFWWDAPSVPPGYRRVF